MKSKTKNSIETASTRASLELLYNISRELVANLDLSTVLEHILFLSIKNLGATSGSIIVLGDQGQPINSAVIHAGELFDEDTQRLRFTLDEGLAGWVKRNKKAALVKDTEKDDRWTSRRFSESDKSISKSSVSAPLLVRDQLVGIMTLSHPEPGYFTEDHLDLVQAIADQAGIAVLNGRLYDDSLRTARIMSAIAESSAAINVSLDLEEVIQKILEQTSKALETEAVSLALIESGKERLEFLAATGKGSKEIVGLRIKLGQGVAGWVAQQGESVIVPDAEQDPRFYPSVDDRTGFHTRSIACAPIRSKGEIIGVLEALNPAHPFNDETLRVLEGIGNLAGAAIDHAKLFEQVELEHRRYLELFEASIDPIVITDIEGNIIQANRQAVLFTGYDQDQINEINIHHFHQVNWNTVGQKFENLSETNPLSYESVLHTKDGQEVQIEVHIRPININPSKRLQWIVRDITERKELDEMREDFTSMIYHDLRSPLANVSSGLDVLATILPEDGDPTIRSVLDIAIRSTERVHRLASALLDTNRLEAGQHIGNTKPALPADLINESIEIVSPISRQKKQSIQTDIPSRLPQVRVDSDMIKRVIINLLENAIKFSPRESAITANAKRKGNWIQISIEDSGLGIPTEEQDLIFEKFHRSPSTGMGSPKGLGIGLAFCKLAVEGHGGKIWVESNNDAGSRFSFTLPIA